MRVHYENTLLQEAVFGAFLYKVCVKVCVNVTTYDQSDHCNWSHGQLTGNMPIIEIKPWVRNIK